VPVIGVYRSETAFIAELVGACQALTLGGQFDEHHVAEFVLCELGDTDLDGVALPAGPLVGVEIPAVLGDLEAHAWNGGVTVCPFFGSHRTRSPSERFSCVFSGEYGLHCTPVFQLQAEGTRFCSAATNPDT